MDFSKLKQRAGKGIESLQEKLETLQGSGKSEDSRLWKPKLDSTQLGSAVIRFLPSKEGESIIKEVRYSFNGPGGWFNEISPVTFGNPCPVRELNNKDWQTAEETGDSSLKNKVRKRTQQVKFYANILVIDEPANPENNGKVFVWKFGKQIKSIIDSIVKPKYSDETPIDPFDMWFGANFKFRSKGKEMPDTRTGKIVIVPSYEDSKFGERSELFTSDDAKKEEIFKQTYSLNEFIDPASVKSYDELNDRLMKVLYGGSVSKNASADNGFDEDLPFSMNDEPVKTIDEKPKELPKKQVVNNDDDDMEFFRSLAG